MQKKKLLIFILLILFIFTTGFMEIVPGGDIYLPLITGGSIPDYPMRRFITTYGDNIPYLSEWGLSVWCSSEQPVECKYISEFYQKNFLAPAEGYNIRFLRIFSEFWGSASEVHFLFPYEGCIKAEGGHVCVTSNGSLWYGTATEVTIYQREDSMPIMAVDICYGIIGDDNWDSVVCNENWVDPPPETESKPTPVPNINNEIIITPEPGQKNNLRSEE